MVFNINIMMPGYRSLLSIGYKYKYQKVLCFILTEESGREKIGIPYLSNCPDHITNVAVRPVAFPHVLSKFFGSVNGIDSHKKFIQSDLALEKLWVTQCGCVWLCTTFDIGINVTNLWEPFHHGVNR